MEKPGLFHLLPEHISPVLPLSRSRPEPLVSASSIFTRDLCQHYSSLELGTTHHQKLFSVFHLGFLNCRRFASIFPALASNGRLNPSTTLSTFYSISDHPITSNYNPIWFGVVEFELF
ncbi:uncharacterized protein LOC126610749 isoform X1 [Malus sylvestris]|uniref:uncharacterized protein LOC126610749 isoform X1 n=1 Tax=Malus sylvestris TaxID=3752 RepID=UPI0021AC7B33|nr:uncharacterized protein LOC126610749 isoform X1 [Malus sylvestris]